MHAYESLITLAPNTMFTNRSLKNHIDITEIETRKKTH